MLVGLHTCGDLACTTLRIFDSAAEAVGGVVSVGCCYMHLTETPSGAGDACAECELGERQSSGGDGFPMSNYVATLNVRVSISSGVRASLAGGAA